MQALQERASHREFAPDPLPPQVLANCFGRPGAQSPGSSGRTAPSPMNRQEMDLYVALADGAYLYDAKTTACSRSQATTCAP